MPRVSASRELLAAREDVWSFIAEPHHFPDWWPGIGGVSRTAVGSRRVRVGASAASSGRRCSGGRRRAGCCWSGRRGSGALRVDPDGRHIDAELRLDARGPTGRSRRSRSRRPGSSASAAPCHAKRSLVCMPCARLVPSSTSSSPSHVRFPLPRRVPSRGLLRACHRHPRRRCACFSRARQHRTQAAGRRPATRREPGRRAQNATVETAKSGRAADSAFVEGTYKSVMANRLKGKKIAVLFIGSSREGSSLGDHVGAGRRRRGTAAANQVRQGPDRPAVLAQKLAQEAFARELRRASDQLQNLGHDLGQEFVAGTDTPLWSALQSVIVEEKTGPSKPPADGVVIVRTVDAADRGDSSLSQGSLRGSRRRRRPRSRCRANERMRSAQSRRSNGQVSRPSTTSRRRSGSSHSSPCSRIRC